MYDDFVLQSDAVITRFEWSQHDRDDIVYLSTEVTIFSGLPIASNLIFSANVIATRAPNSTGALFVRWLGFDYDIQGLSISLPAGTYFLGLNTNVATEGDSSWDETSGNASTIPGSLLINPSNPEPGGSRSQNLVFKVLGSTGLTPIADSFLSRYARNANEGANYVIKVRGADEGERRGVIAFSPDAIDAFINQTGLSSAKLILTITGRADEWDYGEDKVNAHPLLEEFTEGNGKRLGVPRSDRTRGFGQGVTWNCATDDDISNRGRNCDERWRGGKSGPATADPVRHRDGMKGEVMWDVTDDVLSGYTSWLIKTKSRESEGHVSYYSKEGAAEEGNLGLAPRLILE